jgi:hypothetical protein
MKRKTKIIFIIVGIILVVVLCFKNIPFGTTTYKMPNSNVNLKVPKLSSFKEECCMFSATFKSLRSKLSLQMELDKIMSNYEKKICNNKTIYYNEKQDITITEYGVERGLLFNTFYITYDKGEYYSNECSVISDPTKLKYDIKNTDSNYNNNCIIPEKFTYKNKNGEIYNVYYECFGDLLFQAGTEKMNYLHNMLQYGWLSMNDVVDFMEYQVINNKATKEVFKDGGSIMYKNKDFSLLKCNYWTGNQDIYIGDTNMKYEETYCKNLGVEVE